MAEIMSRTHLDMFMEGVNGICRLDDAEKSSVMSIARGLFENAELEIAKSPDEYGKPYIEGQYAKFRDEFFDGDDGYLPDTIEISFNNRTNALGVCRTKLWKNHYSLSSPIRVECTIELTKSYDITKRQLDEVLIHEMVHAYLAYKGASVGDIGLVKCHHGTPFLQKADEINHKSDYHITVTNDDALTLNGGKANKILKDGTILVVFPWTGKTGVSRIAKKDIPWFTSGLKKWLGSSVETELYECDDANFKNRLPVKRSRIGFASFPTSTIDAMINDGVMRKLSESDTHVDSPYAGCIIAARQSINASSDTSFSTIKSYATAAMAHVLKLNAMNEERPERKFSFYKASPSFNEWRGSPCISELRLRTVPTSEFESWIKSGMLTEEPR